MNMELKSREKILEFKPHETLLMDQSEQKFQIVLEGLKGHLSVSEVCNRHQIKASITSGAIASFKKARNSLMPGESPKQTKRPEQQNHLSFDLPTKISLFLPSTRRQHH
ncbi:hypothetical protein N8622_00500 [bacterium]|nr:hypothetical protein [bacterium]